MSVPQPITVPWSDKSVASPPVEPPGVNSGFFGCTVSPHSGLSVSHHCNGKTVSVANTRTGAGGLVPMTYHDRLGQVRLCDDDGAQLLQKRHQNAVLRSWLERTSNVAQSAVESLNVELILQGHAYAMQGSHEFAMFLKMLVQLIGLLQRLVKENLSKAASVSQISGTIITLHVPVCLCLSAMWPGHSMGSGTRL